MYNTLLRALMMIRLGECMHAQYTAYSTDDDKVRGVYACTIHCLEH